MSGAGKDPEDTGRGQPERRRGRRVRGYPSGGPTPGDLGVPPDAVTVDDLLAGEPAVPPGVRAARSRGAGQPRQPEPSGQEPSDQEPSDREPSDQEPSDQEPAVEEGRRQPVWRRWVGRARRAP